jgi:uncharacterized membrane protein
MRGRSVICVWFASLAISLSSTALSAASYKFCNHTMSAIQAVGVEITHNSGTASLIISKGWYALNPGDCEVVWDAIVEGNEYFGYAVDGTGHDWGGDIRRDHRFCVDAPRDAPANANEYPCAIPQTARVFAKLDTNGKVGPFSGQPNNWVWFIGGPASPLGPGRSNRPAPPPPPPPPPATPARPPGPGPQSAPSAPLISPCGCSQTDADGRCVGVCSGSCPTGSHCAMARDLGFFCTCRPDGS